jgi:hypothetical protein
MGFKRKLQISGNMIVRNIRRIGYFAFLVYVAEVCPKATCVGRKKRVKAKLSLGASRNGLRKFPMNRAYAQTLKLSL